LHSNRERTRAAFALVLAGLAVVISGHGQDIGSSAPPPTVGMEGRLEVVLPEAGLAAVAGDHLAPMVVRIAAAQPHGTLTRYDLRYTGRVPGRHDLRDVLLASDGGPATNLPALMVEVAGLLPTPHNGWLEEQTRRAPWFFGGYRVLMGAMIVVWIGALFVVLRGTRRPAAVVVEPRPAAEPSLVDRLRPLVERAAAGELSGDEKACLERMLIAHWQRRLGLCGVGGEVLMGRLRSHPEAGKLMVALEDWLHRRPGSRDVPVEALLRPYQQPPAGQPGETTR